MFLLALHAKLSAYHQSSAANLNSSSKLWLNGQKMEARAPATSAILPIWAVAFFLFELSFRSLRRAESPFRVTSSIPNTEFDPQQFLRPPPAL